jgi:hypothetical protein
MQVNSNLLAMIEIAEAEVRRLQDDVIPDNATPRERARGNQMHRRAVAGRPLVAHISGADWIDHTRSVYHVTLRVEGQDTDRAEVICGSLDEAIAVEHDLRHLLFKRPAPVPAENYCSQYCTLFGDEIEHLSPAAQQSYAACEAANRKLGSYAFAFGVAWWAHKHAEMAQSPNAEAGDAADRW